LRELKTGQLVAAAEEFQRATALDPNYAGDTWHGTGRRGEKGFRQSF